MRKTRRKGGNWKEGCSKSVGEVRNAGVKCRGRKGGQLKADETTTRRN
jgi:hypothetical protein